MITPRFILDSHEQWQPVAVEVIDEVGATRHADRIDFPADMQQPTTPVVGYHRVVHAGILYWHQYWCFYLYNPKKYAGFGAHEGDWEMVQLGCVDEPGDIPILVTCSQHSGGERREYWRCELDQQLQMPKVYVARDSHANYFASHHDVTDQADGKGLALNPEWREFGDWSTWSGKWGNSDNSPGQLSTRRAWTAPHAYHSQARG